jgi:hypothetical protein
MDAVAAVEREMDDADCTQFEHMFTTIPHHSYHTTRLSLHTQPSSLYQIGYWPTTPPPGWVCPNAEGCSGEEIRDAWVSYAPYGKQGHVGALGDVGCPGGGTWCYGDSGPAVSSSSSGSSSLNRAAAQNVAAALAGLGGGSGAAAMRGPPKKYGLGSWNKR